MLDEKQKTLPVGERLAVAPDFRIIPPTNLYKTTEKEFDDKKALEHYGTLEKDKIRAAEDKSAGTKFEMLKTAIMHKHMGERFIVVRSARYDDNKNGVDNILVDKTNGHTLCAFDEISNDVFNSNAVAKKAKEVLSKNFGEDIENSSGFVQSQTGEKGVKLKYGIELNTDGKITCKEVEHLPIFILNLDYGRLDEGQMAFINGEKKSRYETQLFEYFLTTLLAQIQYLRLDHKRYAELPQELRERAESFEKYIQETLPKLRIPR